jgi:hypothetical protein
MSAESNKSNAMLLKVMSIANPKAFQTPKIGLTGMGTWIIQTTAKVTGRQTMNQIWNRTTAVRIQKPGGAECECSTECSRIDSAYTAIKDDG